MHLTHPSHGAWRALWPLALSYSLLVGLFVLIRVGLECVPYYDLGIYAEGAYHWSLRNPNPWLSGRNIHLFNDHFDPVVVLMAPFVHAVPLPYGAVLFELGVMLLGLWPVGWLMHAGRLTRSAGLLLGMLMLFHLGSITAVHYPVHPTTWAYLPWIWMVAALELRQFAMVVVAFVWLMACKEEFPFVAPVLAWLLWRRQQPKHAASVLVLAALWLGVVYGVRPYLLGPIEGYASVPFAGLRQQPWTFVRERLTQKGLYERLPLFVAPFVPTGLWLWWGKHRGAKRDYLALLAPPLALRFLTQQWAHQYHAITAAGMAMSFVPALRGRVVPRVVMVSSALILLATNHDRVRDAASLIAPRLVVGKKHWCAYDRGRLSSLRQSRALVRARADKRMLVGMANLPKLVDLHHTFVPPGPPSERDRPWELVFFEKPPFGMDWPVEYDDIKRWIAQWRAQEDTHILLDDDHIFVAEGCFVAPVQSSD